MKSINEFQKLLRNAGFEVNPSVIVGQYSSSDWKRFNGMNIRASHWYSGVSANNEFFDIDISDGDFLNGHHAYLKCTSFELFKDLLNVVLKKYQS